MGELLLVIDEGTTSTRAMLFEPGGKCLGQRAAELTQHYPSPGLVEHDAAEIWDCTLACTRAMVEQAGITIEMGIAEMRMRAVQAGARDVDDGDEVETLAAAIDAEREATGH